MLMPEKKNTAIILQMDSLGKRALGNYQNVVTTKHRTVLHDIII